MKAIIEQLSSNAGSLPIRDYIKSELTAMGGAHPDTIKMFKSLSVEVIGHVKEGNLAHVVIRMRIPDSTGVKQEVKVFTVKAQSGKYWYTRSGGGTFMSQLFEK